MLKNKVKENLKNKKPSVGVIIGIYSPALVEMIGHAGYDFIIIDCLTQEALTGLVLWYDAHRVQKYNNYRSAHL